VQMVIDAKAMVVRVELGIQQGLNSTLNSYLEKLMYLMTGHFGRAGTHWLHSWLVPLWGNTPGARHFATQAEVICGLLSPNVFPDAVLSEHPERLRALWVDSSNPVNTAADTARVLAAMKALELDKTLGEAHAALAYAEWFYDWDWSTAEREFKAAIELSPSSAISHQRYAECLFTRTRFDEGIRERKRAEELDPISTHSLGGLGHAYLVMGRYDESIPHFQKALDLYPNAAFIRAQLAWSYASKSMYPQALAEYDKIAEPDKAVAAENQLVADGLVQIHFEDQVHTALEVQA